MSATQEPTTESKFRLVRTLGKGAFGKVLLIRKTENGNSTDQSYNKWLSGSELDELPWNKMDQVTIDFFKEILTNEPEKRATIEQIKSHPWLEEKKQTTTVVNGNVLKRKENSSEVPESDAQPISNVKRQRL
ncbi:hypothetical protein CAEBREN_03453 [Caenorhabditis brenneri]|uniref:Protein kinase domain-containing protein n=1 Tax=Caenorhabditis brenneri TaxID=135651 RepID=G0PAW0_CAEBE|nr:hypothetical protein CAEBREN_03453 [Caenorhabditis brenneri]